MKNLIIGISGASGVRLGIEMLKVLKSMPDVRTHLVLSDNALITLNKETGREVTAGELQKLADFCYEIYDMAADIASGSFKTDGMVIIPCSMKTLAGVANGFSDNLLLRAADVTLKEGRSLVVVPREAPFSRIHLKNMLKVQECGGVIIPPVMTFYNNLQSIDEMIDYLIGKILDRFDIDYSGYRRWGSKDF
ncbi:MAG: UbiX family flavin prenyltransferase [Lachnospiraceae bacterium]|jgi:4-hydroxy-3-polyprenylbenzoate decarboxylase